MASHRFDPLPENLRTVRAFVAHHLEEAGFDPWPAVLVVSELATNVVLHARTPFEVRVEVADDVLLEVEDGNAVARLEERVASGNGGRGLALVARLAREWGVSETGGGKSVWAIIPTEQG